MPGVDGAGADDEELYDPAAELEVQPQPEPVQRQTMSDRRQALLQLAKKVCAEHHCLWAPLQQRCASSL